MIFIICRKMEHIFSKPNQITFIRILLIPVFVMFLLIDIAYRDYIAAFIFIILSLSDALDGYIARKKSQVTGIGKIIDPIADKLLVASVILVLTSKGTISGWTTLPAFNILFFEIAVSVPILVGAELWGRCIAER